ncbi:MAG: hypothetical protein ACD_3C00048G0005 [uncultured bacterium (gcode 4)]|uniref:Uncharacterized protein n=1 Tax=uncultured bacterium (gcode 4) TaxID=1234023 RepID=K2GYM5_9BACT|nr:MAG: hypothetical protein ACD_3C00048G0005 [uncultured bacterium (gcode 4)]
MDSKKLSNLFFMISIVSFMGIYFPMKLYTPNTIPEGIGWVLRISIILFITSTVIALLSWARSVSKTEPDDYMKFAHWSYTDDEWRKFLLIDKKLDAEFKKTITLLNTRLNPYLNVHKEKILYIFTFFMVLMSSLYGIALPRYASGIIIMAIVFEIIFCLWFYFAIRSSYLSNKSSEVIIFGDGKKFIGIKIWNNTQILTPINWWIDSVDYNESSDPRYLEFKYSFNSRRYSIITRYLRVPVPQYEKNMSSLLEKLRV